MESYCPPLLSNKDTIENEQEISLEGGYLHIGDLRKPLFLFDFFYIYKWQANNTSCLTHPIWTSQNSQGILPPINRRKQQTVEEIKQAQTRKDGTDRNQEDSRRLRNLQTERSKPRLFRLTLGTEESPFNHKVVVDTMLLNSKPVLHLVHKNTHFTAACFLENQTTAEIS